MTNWTKEQVEQVLVDKGWYQSEREIQDAIQFILVDNTRVNLFTSGKAGVQGKATEIQMEAKTIFENAPSFSNYPAVTANPPNDPTKSSTPNRVFIVYGHDINARKDLALILYGFKLTPIVLANVPSGGTTLIEKLEDLTDADYACVLLTPDDKGYPAQEPEKIQFRARQNVVLELGMVLAKLGRSRVAILVKGNDLERPSDIDGLIYLHFTECVDEVKPRLAAELAKAGFSIDVVNLA